MAESQPPGGGRNAQLPSTDLFECVTLHGVRLGGAISAALRGDNLQAILSQGHWSNSRMASRYMRLREVLGHGTGHSTPEELTPADYRSLNVLENFAFVFPWAGSPAAPPPPPSEDN
jgi:hypothetical protein